MEQKKDISKIIINSSIKKGKKIICEKIFQKILINLKKKTKQKPKFIFYKTIKILTLNFKLINILSKKNKYILIYLTPFKQIKNAYKLLIQNSNKKKFINSITDEIINTYNFKSKTLNTKKDLLKNLYYLKYNIKF